MVLTPIPPSQVRSPPHIPLPQVRSQTSVSALGGPLQVHSP